MPRVRAPKVKYPHVIPVRLTEEDFKALSERAKEERRPLSQLLRVLVQDGLKSRRLIR